MHFVSLLHPLLKDAMREAASAKHASDVATGIPHMAMKVSPLQPPFLPRVYYSALVDKSPNGVTLNVSVGCDTEKAPSAKSKAEQFIEKA